MAQTKKFFRLQHICKKIAKGQEFEILQFYESMNFSLSGGFITENSVLHRGNVKLPYVKQRELIE